jgi:UDP-N-acetylmuramoylalanine--D-glutamate ligase
MVKKILIVGFGKSGQWLSKILDEKKSEYEVYDDKINTNPDLKNIDAAFISPGIPRSLTNSHQIFEILGKNCIPIISDYDLLFYFKPNAKFIGITGTSGKTTTTMLISHFLHHGKISHHLCGNLGIDMFNLSSDLFVIEIGAAQLEFVRYLTFDLGIITNLIPDHLDFFDCKERYIAAKLNILRKKNNSDQKFFLGNGCPKINVPKLEIEENIDINLIPEGELRLAHNFQNIKIAFSVVKNFGCDISILNSLKNFQLANYRQKSLGKINNSLVINDSKATNSVAVEAALNNFENIFLFIGGHFKTFDFDFIKKHQPKIRECVCFGEHGKNIHDFLRQINIKSHLVKKLQDCEQILEQFIKDDSEKCILFSPFGQSFDEFKNYEERGSFFDKLIHKIQKNF